MKKHVGYADGKRLILNRKQGKKFNLGGGVNDFKNNAIAKLKQWKNEKLEDINYSAKILGITNINPSYIKAFNKLNDLVEDCTKIIKSGILKDGEFTYWKTFNVKTYKGSIETQAYFTLEKEIAYSNPKFDKDFIEFKTKYPYSTKDSFSKEFIGRMTISILGYKLCDYATIGHSTANSVGGFRNNLYAKGGLTNKGYVSYKDKSNKMAKGGEIENIKVGDEIYARWSDSSQWTLGTFKGETKNGFEVYDRTIERPEYIEFYPQISKLPHPYGNKKTFYSKKFKDRNYKNYHFIKEIQESNYKKKGGGVYSAVMGGSVDDFKIWEILYLDKGVQKSILVEGYSSIIETNNWKKQNPNKEFIQIQLYGDKFNDYAKGGKPLLLKIGDKVEGYFYYDHTYGQYNIIPYNAYADNSKGIVIDIIKGASWPRYKIKFENGETLNLAEFMLGEYYDKLNYAEGGMPQGLSIADANPYIAGAKAIKGIAPSSFSALDERLAKKINPDPYRPVFF